MTLLRMRATAVASSLVLAGAFQIGGANAEIRTQVIEYKQGNTVLEGVLVYDDAVQGRRPGVLLGHTWTGVSDFTRMRAERYARLGYVAFVADVYGKGVRPTPPRDTAAEMQKYMTNRPLLRARALAGLDILRNQATVDASKLLAAGYCFGGAMVLELARSGAPLAGVVSYHGSLSSPTPDDAKSIKARVLVLHGADDPVVPAKEVEAFEKEMRDAKVDWQLVAYGGTVHSFTDPKAGNDNSKGAAYNERSEKRSWTAMQAFFKEIVNP